MEHTYFTFNTITYRTNADASVVEAYNAKARDPKNEYVRTHSLSVRSAAKQAISMTLSAPVYSDAVRS